MEEGVKLLHDCSVRAIRQMGYVGALRRLMDAGLVASKEALARKTESFWSFLLQKPHWRRQLGLPDSQPPESLTRGIGQRDADRTAEQALQVVTAAELVFTHSLTDGIAEDCCRAATLLAPAKCERYVSAEQVSLGDIRRLGADVLVKGALEKLSKQLGRKSLANRIAWLFAVCPPAGPLELMPEYVYDADRIVRLDDRRQKVVHTTGVDAASDVSRDDITFLEQTAVFLPDHVMRDLGVELDVGYTSAMLKQAGVPTWPKE